MHVVENGVAMQDLADSVSDMSKSNDWFLVAPDFTDYMRAQVSPRVWFGTDMFIAVAVRIDWQDRHWEQSSRHLRSSHEVIAHACRPLMRGEQDVPLHCAWSFGDVMTPCLR